MAAAAPVPRVQRAPGPGPAMAQRGGPAVLPDNPFQDPAALQARPGAVLDGYNPFENDAVSGGAFPETGACPCTGASSRAPEPSPLPAQPHLSSLPLQPPPPFQTPSVAPPPPVPAAAQPPRKASPTEPRSYGSYGSQVRGQAPPGRADRGDTGAGGSPGFVSPPPQASAAAATAELLKRQEELNRKAEELDRRERELQNAALGGSQSEWLRGWGETRPPRISPRSSSPPSVHSEAQQLAPAAVLLPGEALLLPGHPRGDPC